jgi:hypothetical protein
MVIAKTASHMRAAQNPMEVAADHHKGKKGHDSGGEYLS